MNTEKRKITDNNSLQKFVDEVKGLHDSLLHEAIFIHPGYVAKDGKMFGDYELPNAKLIFQSQFNEIPGIILYLREITTFRYDPKLEFELEAEIDNSEIRLYLAGQENESLTLITAKEMEYQIVGENYRGPEYEGKYEFS